MARFDQLSDAGQVYDRADPALRRALNRGWFSYLLVTEDDDGLTVTDVNHEPITGAVNAALDRRREDAAERTPVETNRKRRQLDAHGVANVLSSNFALLVELRGFEPLTFSLRTRRATNCATAPSRRAPGGVEREDEVTTGTGDVPNRVIGWDCCHLVTAIPPNEGRAAQGQAPATRRRSEVSETGAAWVASASRARAESASS